MPRTLKIPHEIAARSDLTATAKLVYGVIAGMNGNDHTMQEMARCIGGSRRGVQEAIYRLVARGDVTVTRSMPNKYSLTSDGSCP